jgi:hypothetical protein
MEKHYPACSLQAGEGVSMGQRITWRVAVWTIALCLVILQAGPALAGIGVEQTVTEIEVVPDVEKAGIFTVANGDNQEVLVRAEPEDWLKLRTGSSPVEVKDWLTIDEAEFKLGPGEVKNIGYRVKVPPGIGGELIAQVFFSSAGPSGGNLNVTSRFGVALYVGIEGTEVIDPEITGIKTDKTIIGITVRNRGNVHLRPSGTVIIKDGKGNIEQQLQVPYTAVIFGSKTHVYAVSVDAKKLSRGKKTLEANFDIGTVYGKTKPFSKTISFYYK